MPLTPSDLRFYLSVRTALSGYVAASTPNGSLGGFVSISRLSAGVEALFGNADQATLDVPNYRCVFLVNLHATLPLLSPSVYLDPVGGARLALGIDPLPPGPVYSVRAQAVTVKDELTGPAGVMFPAAVQQRSWLTIEDIPAGNCRAIWVCRTTALAAGAAAGGTLGVQGTTDLHLMTRAL